MRAAKNLVARWVTPLLWRLSPERQLQTLERFSATELDSGWQLLRAAPRFSGPAAQAQLFFHALEELEHARLFEDAARRRSAGLRGAAVHAREPLLEEPAGLEQRLDFLAHFHVGEKDAYEDFTSLAAAPLEEDLRSLFARIVAEEAGHDEGAMSLLEREAGGARVDGRVLRQTLRRRKESVLRFLRRLDGPLAVALSAIYYVLGPFFRSALRERMELGRDEQLLILEEQVASHAASLRDPT